MSEQMTPEQALAQGYTKYMLDDDNRVHDIADIARDNIDVDMADYFVCEKDPEAISISAEELRQQVIDHLYALETPYNETDDMEDAVKKIDIKHFEDLANRISDELLHLESYKQTYIRLIP